jgi:hypothetical protein
MLFPADPRLVLALAAFRQDDVRASYPRRQPDRTAGVATTRPAAEPAPRRRFGGFHRFHGRPAAA